MLTRAFFFWCKVILKHGIIIQAFEFPGNNHEGFGTAREIEAA